MKWIFLNYNLYLTGLGYLIRILNTNCQFYCYMLFSFMTLHIEMIIAINTEILLKETQHNGPNHVRNTYLFPLFLCGRHNIPCARSNNEVPCLKSFVSVIVLKLVLMVYFVWKEWSAYTFRMAKTQIKTLINIGKILNQKSSVFCFRYCIGIASSAEFICPVIWHIHNAQCVIYSGMLLCLPILFATKILVKLFTIYIYKTEWNMEKTKENYKDIKDDFYNFLRIFESKQFIWIFINEQKLIKIFDMYIHAYYKNGRNMEKRKELYKDIRDNICNCARIFKSVTIHCHFYEYIYSIWPFSFIVASIIHCLGYIKGGFVTKLFIWASVFRPEI